MKMHTLQRLFYFGCFYALFVFSNPIFAQDTFEEFPWLNDLIDVNDCCQNQRITAYQSGIYQFIYIERGADCADLSENELYFENGTFYCLDINGMDCRAAYGLTEDHSRQIWSCEPAKIAGCENILAAEWIQEYLEEDCTGNIYSFDYKGEQIVYITTLCACVDATDLALNCDGEPVCFFGFTDAVTACNPEILDNLTSDNLIWAPECDCPCPVDFTPVCGVDGNTYETACEATCAGIEILDREACQPQCSALAAINISSNLCENCIEEIATYTFEGAEYVVTFGDNKTCSDAITTVQNCDSTTVFCYNGGIAGFNQCQKFFDKAVKIETKWSKKLNCNGATQKAEPCTDLEKVDFGDCEAVMGIGLKNGECVTISGCLDFVVKGIDYSAAFFPTVEICQQSCEVIIVEDSSALFFDKYPWLLKIVDLNNCGDTRIEVYDFGNYQFLYVATSQSGTLYYEDGTLYCTDLPNYNCRALYNLKQSQISDKWVCGKGLVSTDGPVSPSSPIAPITSDAFTRTVFTAFPNPTGGKINVNVTPNLPQSQWLTVYNLYGQRIEQIEVTANSGQATYAFDLSNADAGVYFVEWRTATDKKVEKIIKQ